MGLGRRWEAFSPNWGSEESWEVSSYLFKAELLML